MITGLAHTGVCVPDCAAAVAFYRDVLGLRVLSPPYVMAGNAIRDDMGELVSDPTMKAAIVGFDDGSDRVLEVIEYLNIDGSDGRARAALTDHGLTVTARVFLDDHGYPINFSTTDRYADLPGGLVQAEWTTPIDGWKTDADRLVFTRGRAIWQHPDGPLDYLEFRTSPGAIRYNLTPGDITTAPPQP